MDVFAHIPSAGPLINLAPIHQFFRNLGYPEEDERIVIEGIPVQILAAASPLEDEAIDQALDMRVGSVPTRVFTAEHAVAIALKTNRAKDRMKILHLLESAPAALDRDRLDAILQRHGLADRWRKFEDSLDG